jgi:hypothetical protein
MWEYGRRADIGCSLMPIASLFSAGKVASAGSRNDNGTTDPVSGTAAFLIPDCQSRVGYDVAQSGIG